MSCIETYATLRIFSQTMHPDEISQRLTLDATRARPIDPESKYRPRRENNFWAWSTREKVESTDGLEHIKAIVQALAGKEQNLDALRDAGCEIDVSCYWLSSGQGGPYLDTSTLADLSRLQLSIWWDVYFHAEDDRDIAGGT